MDKSAIIKDKRKKIVKVKKEEDKVEQEVDYEFNQSFPLIGFFLGYCTYFRN